MSTTTHTVYVSSTDLREQYGLGERAIEAIFAALPVTRPGARTRYVKRADVEAYLEERTRA